MASTNIVSPTLSPELSSAETITNNEDLLTQILLCLPIKSLQKFKSVSKHWLNLISDPDFLRRLHISNSPYALLVHQSSSTEIAPEYDFIKLDSGMSDAPFKTLTFDNNSPAFRILQSCNGLFLCCSHCWNKSEIIYYIYNPTTNQYTKLPPLDDSEENIHGPYLAFDPSKSPNYKVICLRRCNNTRDVNFEIEIYSSNTRLWRVSDEILKIDDMDCWINGGVFWNGAIHWYTNYGSDFYFDVDREHIKEMPMPPKNIWKMTKYFGQSRGHFYLVEYYDTSSSQFNVCEMEKDYLRWSVKYCVDLDGVATAFPEMIHMNSESSSRFYVFQILCIVNGGEMNEDSYMVLHLPGNVIRYNFKDRNFNKLCDSNPRESTKNFKNLYAFEYIKSVAGV